MNQQLKTKPKGFTLVEILVVLVIATVVISIAIPRIRAVNKERNIREAARVVGSAFANASQRATIDGVAGVRITRNANFDQGGVQFAATEISLLRAVPSYTGDTEDAALTAVDEGASTVTIDRPFEQDDLEIIRAGDSISFGSSSVRYRISSVSTSGALVLSLDRSGTNDYLPMPPDESKFVIHRLPRLLRSSTSDLPAGHIIDLRYSGFELLDGHTAVVGLITRNNGCYDVAGGNILARQLTTVFEPAPTDFDFGGTTVPPLRVENYDIDIIFDEDGAVDFILYTEIDHNKNGFADEDEDGIEGETVFRRPLGPIHLLVTEASDSFELSEEIATASDNNLWVTISNNTGTANVGYNDSNQQEPLVGQFVNHQGTDVATLSTYYFAPVDADLNLDDDRDEFNALINAARSQTATSANQ
jgi:prepilin-type N-terminal cleavage/methylation domain-containing protein